MENERLKPMLFTVLKGYTGKQFVTDLISGIIVAIIALPLSIALALASGVGPQEGLYTAIVAGFIISFLGGSRVQIAGPTAAFATIVAGIVATKGMEGLALATIFAGILLILMGVFKLGSLIKFIPYTITTGFTAGIAVTIAIGQVKDFLGLTYPAGTTTIETVDKVKAIVSNIGTLNIWALVVGLVCLAIQIVWPKINQKIPGSLIAVIVGILMVKFLGLNVNTIGDLYEISGKLPTPHIPTFDFKTIQSVAGDGFTIAILAAIESLLSCVVADSMIDSKHRSNMELVAQGVGNIGSALFGGIPATGAIARTAANIKNGGRTPVAGMIHSICLVLVLVVLMPFAALIPMPTIASILFMVAYNMCQYKVFTHLVKTAPKSDIIVLVTTFILTVVFDLVVAIEIGMVLACLLFMKRMSEESRVRGWKYYDPEDDPDGLGLKDIPKHVRVYEISGPMFFGDAEQIAEISFKEFTRALVIRMRGVPAIDATAMHSFEQLYEKCKKNNVQLVFSHVNEQPMNTMEKDGFVDLVGRENFQPHIDDALKRAAEI
ncbi:sulfate permease, SulP family [Butyrivibrio hungatei DSM 14810]|uniref:Sulfate permease, SulP family n=1 Tax=Butyrivibrio hungatei DSM 14810 TaxID=1121132 RepID=A0A1M7S6I6_9FIRM|nr:sulfate permease [Butyrivibrio hungatei]SHN54076.1 sulfate permease, SulP family [Butyrivibrio hungatei DSM 14810]